MSTGFMIQALRLTASGFSGFRLQVQALAYHSVEPVAGCLNCASNTPGAAFEMRAVPSKVPEMCA